MTDAWEEPKFSARQIMDIAQCLSQMVQLHGDYVSAYGEPSFYFCGDCLDFETGGTQNGTVGSVGLSEDGKPYVELSDFASETDKLYQMIGWCKYHGVELRTNFDMVKAA